MADEGLFSGQATGPRDPGYEVGPVDPKVTAMLAFLTNAANVTKPLTPADIPIIFKPEQQDTNAAVLTAMITQLTKDSPENLAAVTTIIGAVLKIKVS